MARCAKSGICRTRLGCPSRIATDETGGTSYTSPWKLTCSARPSERSVAMAAAAATMSAAVAGRFRVRGAYAGRGERGNFLEQFPGAAERAFRAFPVAGTDEDFAVALALLAMKFVN